MTPPPKGMENPFETPLPDSDLFPDDEVSQVKNAPDAWKKLEKLDRVLTRMVDPIQQIPKIAEKVDGVIERVAKVEERLDTTKERVNGLDEQSRRPHDCFQVDNIERIEVGGHSLRKDVEEDTKKLNLVSAEVEHIKTNVKAAKELRRSNHYYWIGIATSFLLAGAGAVWYMRGVSAEIQMEAMARDAQFKQVETVLTKVSKQTDPAPMVEQIEQLRTSVDKSNGDADLTEWCSKLSEDDVQRIKVVLPRQSWPECSRLKSR